MKHIKKLNEYFKIFENTNESLFINEHKLKQLLLQDDYFAKGEVHQAIVNIAYNEWNEKNPTWSYNNMLKWVSKTFGNIPLLSIYIGTYNGEVCNGGHSQYYQNGYASLNKRGYYGSNYKDIETHEDFVELFNDLDMNNILESGKEAYNIMKNFDLTLGDETEMCHNCGGSGDVDCSTCNGNGETDCPGCGGSGEDDEGEKCEDCDGSGLVNCEDCDGKGYVTCEDCDGSGEEIVEEDVADQTGWDKLDTKWYEINDNLLTEFNDYLKTLTLDGEKMTELIEVANGIQKYNL